MTRTLYFDDPEVGPAKATSHPAFVKLCKGELFYDVGDEFGPFGSDSGSDTLAGLQDWLRAKKPRTVRAFITKMMKDWDMTLPNLRETRVATVTKWLTDPAIALVLTEVNQMIIAAAFGQYKITGTVEAEVHELAVAANAREVISTAYHRHANPAWKHGKANAVANAMIGAALAKMITAS